MAIASWTGDTNDVKMDLPKLFASPNSASGSSDQCLVWNGKWQIGCYSERAGESWWESNYGPIEKVTHWIPVPADQQ